MNGLSLVKSDRFGQTECDIYSDNNEMFMTMAQLSDCLGYASKDSFKSLISRNDYIKGSEFSKVVSICNPLDNAEKGQETRVFTEDGIYEITMLAKTEKAKEFRAWVRKLMKSLRRGKVNIVETDKLAEMEAKARYDRATAMRMNAENRRLKLLLSNPNWKGLSDVALQAMGIKAVEEVTGQNLGNMLPKCDKTYSATEVCKIFNGAVTPQKLGSIAKANNLKAEQYGIWAMDKSPYSSKEVSTFRYNLTGIKKLAEIIGITDYSITD